MHTRYDVVAVSSEVKRAWMLQTAHSFLLGSYRAESSRPKFYVWPCWLSSAALCFSFADVCSSFTSAAHHVQKLCYFFSVSEQLWDAELQVGSGNRTAWALGGWWLPLGKLAEIEWLEGNSMCREHLDAREHLAFLSCITLVVFLQNLIVPDLLLWVSAYQGWQQLQLMSFRCLLFPGSVVELPNTASQHMLGRHQTSLLVWS